MRILHLTLKRKWFDLIASGKKTIEYREYKPYWEKRLVGKNYQEVHFRNGYAKNAPFMRVKLNSIINVKYPGASICIPENGEELNGWYFAIVLGPVLKIMYNKRMQQSAKNRAG